MDEKIKHYADALYERSLHESARTLTEERVRSLQEMSARRSVNALPLSGSEIQRILKLFVQHVERCMEARLESYRKAYGEAKQSPTDEEFGEILASVQYTQKLQITHSAQALREFMKTRGVDGDVTGNLTTNSAHGHDRVLGEWKIWRGQVHLIKAVGADDRKFARMALEEAKRSVAEDDRVHPKVGVVIVKDGEILGSAHRGESLEGHAEYIALEKKLADAAVAGATVYTTLEPCTTRNHPKIPCVERLIERRVGRVVIGMLDPNPRITGRGQRKLSSANIITDLFPHDLMREVEEMNREFTRKFESGSTVGDSAPLAVEPHAVSTPHSTTDVVDKWVSLGYEHKSGVAKTLDEQGFDLGWVSADKEVEKSRV